VGVAGAIITNPCNPISLSSLSLSLSLRSLSFSLY